MDNQRSLNQQQEVNRLSMYAELTTAQAKVVDLVNEVQRLQADNLAKDVIINGLKKDEKKK